MNDAFPLFLVGLAITFALFMIVDYLSDIAAILQYMAENSNESEKDDQS